jgi:hypothetical protein
MKSIFIKPLCAVLLSVVFMGCGKTQTTQKTYTGIDKASFDKRCNEVKTHPPNFTIVYGLELGVSEPAFDIMLAEKVKNGTIKPIDMDAYPPMIQFDVLNGEFIPMAVHCSASGLFKNYPVISFKTKEIKDTNELKKTRNQLIDWAIQTYGDQYHVSPMTDYSTNQNGKNFRWVANTYSIDITDIMNRVSLAYRKLE